MTTSASLGEEAYEDFGSALCNESQGEGGIRPSSPMATENVFSDHTIPEVRRETTEDEEWLTIPKRASNRSRTNQRKKRARTSTINDSPVKPKV